MRPNPMSYPLVAAGLVAVALGGAPTPVAAGEVHLRVEIKNLGSGEERVKMNLPLAAIDAIVEAAGPELAAEWGDLKQETHGVDLHKLYRSLRDQDLSDLLEMSGDDGERVKVWKDSEAFRVQVWEGTQTEPKVKIQLPLEVTDVLFGGPDATAPDLKGALEKLKEFAPMTLVEIRDDDESVRIWLE
jgi:hypothetical protein